jgi:hypothetical protein
MCPTGELSENVIVYPFSVPGKGTGVFGHFPPQTPLHLAVILAMAGNQQFKVAGFPPPFGPGWLTGREND